MANESSGGMTVTRASVNDRKIRAGSAATALMSACVSGPLDRAATSGIGTRAAVPNGAASATACELGALAGRNLVLLFWVTLFSEGSSDAAAIAPATHVISTSQRNLTAREPIVLKMVSICTRRAYVPKLT